MSALSPAQPGDHRDLHRVDRRQRQMCIRDRYCIYLRSHVNSRDFNSRDLQSLKWT